MRNRAISGVRRERQANWLDQATPEEKQPKKKKKVPGNKQPIDKLVKLLIAPTTTDPNIDPRAEHDFEEAGEGAYENKEADVEELGTLMSIVFQSKETEGQTEKEDMENLIVGVMLEERDTSSTNVEFIEKFSKINVFKVTIFGG